MRLGSWTVLALLMGPFPSKPVSAADAWRWTASVESAQPSGWVQVREKEVEGTRLHFKDDLGVDRRNGIRLGATKTLSPRSEWQLSLATYVLDGKTVLPQAITFNGATISAGPLRTATHYTHFLQFDASYARRLVSFRRGGTCVARFTGQHRQ